MMTSEQIENWADELLMQYEDGRSELRKMGDELNMEDLKDKQDKKQINSMINDMSFSIDWMKTGRRPGNMRGIDKRSAYQRRALVDMDLFPSLDIGTEEKVLSQDERKKIMDILMLLSHRERQCFLLHQAQGMSYAEIHRELNVSRSSVQKYVERAKKKVENALCHASVMQNHIEDERGYFVDRAL